MANANIGRQIMATNWGNFRTFDPNRGNLIRKPPGEGKGYWAGAPSVSFDEMTKLFYLAYRLRRPRGVDPDRGAEIRIAISPDGIEFEDIWTGFKDALSTTSIERCTLARLPEGNWGFYVSYVDPTDNRWRIDLVETDDIADIDLHRIQPVLTAADIQAEGVKDPNVFQVAGMYHMLVSYATGTADASAKEMHGTHDAYNTGLIKSKTGLATSHDGRNWRWQGEIFGPSQTGWDRYCARIGTVWREDGIWLGLYDGSADVSENYEERCGLAFSYDLQRFERVTCDRPLFEQTSASGALRYFDVVVLERELFYYYETARSDGSHDLRVFRQTT